MISVHYDEITECWTVTTERGFTRYATKYEALRILSRCVAGWMLGSGKKRDDRSQQKTPRQGQ